MREHQDLREGELMHSNVECLLLTLALYELIQHFQLLFQLLRYLVLNLTLLITGLLVVVPTLWILLLLILLL